MPEQNPPEREPTTSPYIPYGANGGGGQTGNYVFTDLDHLDRVIAKWTKIRDDIAHDGVDIEEAVRQIVAPANDQSSVSQAKAARASLTMGLQHNNAMIEYANNYIEKLQATRAQFAATEEANTDTLRNMDETR